MKSSWVSFTPSTSPPHLVITTGYTQSLQCRKGIVVSTQWFLSAAPFFSLVSSAPSWCLQGLQGIPAWVPGPPPPPPAPLPSLTGLFLRLYPHLSWPGSILPFLTQAFPEVPPSWLRSSAVP